MTTVLVTGANGFVGRALCAALARSEYCVRGLVRDLSRSVGLHCELGVVGDIGAATDWSAALNGVGCGAASGRAGACHARRRD